MTLEKSGMNSFRTLVLALAFGFPLASMAQLTDDDHMRYTEALRDGDVKLVKKYLDGDAKPNDKFFGWSALQIAATKGQLKVVQLLVERGAELDYQHPISKNTAFHMAAFGGHDQVVKFLATKGADINIKMRADVSIIRAVRDEGNTKMVELLTSLGVKDDGCLEDKCF
jgi:ankyrin repeat protein